MTELSFLIELLLNHELKKETKDLIAGRIKEVEANLIPMHLRPSMPLITGSLPISNGGWGHSPSPQAASTVAAMARHGGAPNTPVIPDSPPEPVVLTGNELQAKQNSIDILKRNKANRFSK